MSKERDLLPWVLGAVLATAVAAAIAAISSNKTAAPVQAAPVVAAQPTPAPVIPAPAPSPEASTPEPQAPAADAIVQAAAESPEPSGQIWECTTNGVKTFSNNPCGNKSTRLEIGPINTMNPTPAFRYARANTPEPRYAPAYAGSDSSDQDSYSDQGSGDSGGNSYTVIQGVGFVPRRHLDHPHHRPTPHHRNTGPMQR
ncbi:MAG TPA: hypothetical protein VGI90_13525 [Steroidobacteraceae bacterium]|jgi:hypothetical protein